MRIPLAPALVAALLFGAVAVALPATPAEAGRPATHVYSRIGTLRLHLDAFRPGGGAVAAAPAVVVIHGGGWRSGHRRAWSATAQDLAAQGWAVFSVDYRLSGDAPFPAAVDDVRAAIGWIRSHAPRLGVDPDRIALVGGSAGGNLALLAATGPEATPVSAVVAWSAPTDLSALAAAPAPPRLEAIVAEWLGCAPASCPQRAAAASPLHTIESGALPALLLATGSDELVPASQATGLHERALARGGTSELVVVPGARHSSAYRADVWDATVAFLRAHLS